MNDRNIPISDAKAIANRCSCDQVIIIGWWKRDGRTHVTTFGTTVEDCDQVAQAGNWLKEFLLKWPKGECEAVPNRVTKLKDKIAELQYEIGQLRRAVSEREGGKG